MKTLARNVPVAAALACLVCPSVGQAQNIASQPGSVNRGVERLTLLTGPHLLSPATRPLPVSTISSERIAPGAPATPQGQTAPRFEFQQRIQSLDDRLNQGQAERDAKRRKDAGDTAAPAPAGEVPRFESRAPDTPTGLMPRTPALAPRPEIKRE